MLTAQEAYTKSVELTAEDISTLEDIERRILHIVDSRCDEPTFRIQYPSEKMNGRIRFKLTSLGYSLYYIGFLQSYSISWEM